jgi:hypothetical protein
MPGDIPENPRRCTLVRGKSLAIIQEEFDAFALVRDIVISFQKVTRSLWNRYWP